jgi:hypothetical protein
MKRMKRMIGVDCHSNEPSLQSLSSSFHRNEQFHEFEFAPNLSE